MVRLWGLCEVFCFSLRDVLATFIWKLMIRGPKGVATDPSGEPGQSKMPANNSSWPTTRRRDR